MRLDCGNPTIPVWCSSLPYPLRADGGGPGYVRICMAEWQFRVCKLRCGSQLRAQGDCEFGTRVGQVAGDTVPARVSRSFCQRNQGRDEGGVLRFGYPVSDQTRWTKKAPYHGRRGATGTSRARSSPWPLNSLDWIESSRSRAAAEIPRHSSGRCHASANPMTAVYFAEP
jgi:hypothetical protein